MSQYDFIIESGISFILPLLWEDENGDPVDITGYDAQLEIRQTKTSPDVLLKLSVSNGKITVGGANGIFTLNCAPADTEDLEFQDAVYDMLIEKDTIRQKFLSGKVSMGRTITAWS